MERSPVLKLRAKCSSALQTPGVGIKGLDG